MAGLGVGGTMADFGGYESQMGGVPELLDSLGKSLEEAAKKGLQSLVEGGKIIIKDAAGRVVQTLADNPENRALAERLAQQQATQATASWLQQNQKLVIAGAGILVALLVLNMVMGMRR